MNEKSQNSSPPLKIELKNVKRHFGNKKVLDGIDLTVKDGESVVIIGGSGTGKSVTLKCILGLLTPQEGNIFFDGQSIVGIKKSERDRVNNKIGMLFQYAALFDSLNIWQNVAFGLIYGQGMAKDEAYEIAIERLADVGLGADVAPLMPDEVSGGMKKRIALARAIATKPEVIFFDEPTTGLDPITGDVINELIRDCVKNIGATALSITHDMSSVRKIADRVAMLYQGKIIWCDTVEAMDKTDNPYVRQFITGSGEGPIKTNPRQ